MKTFKICSALVVKKLDTVFSTDFRSVESILLIREGKKKKEEEEDKKKRMEPPYTA